jgi:hypothetical protein
MQMKQILVLATVFAFAPACSTEPGHDASVQDVSNLDITTSGPIDGTWNSSTATCDGAMAAAPPFVLTVAGASGTFRLTFAATCVATIGETYAYSGGSIMITPTTVMCSPDTGCGTVFDGGTCIPLPAPATFSFVRNGSALTFTKVAGPGDPCTPGQTLVYTMTRQ